MFTEVSIVDEAVEQLSRAADHRQFAILAYCFMPDHLHVLAEGESPSADFVKFANLLKQRTAYAFWRRNGEGSLWQKGYFEHVVRDDELTQTIAKYILENPVRAGLTREPLEYPFSGPMVFTREQLVDLWRDTVSVTARP